MQPPQAPRMRSKIDTLIFTPDSVKARDREDTAKPTRDQIKIEDVAEKEIEVEVEVENVERPVDLYKVL